MRRLSQVSRIQENYGGDGKKALLKYLNNYLNNKVLIQTLIYLEFS